MKEGHNLVFKFTWKHIMAFLESDCRSYLANSKRSVGPLKTYQLVVGSEAKNYS